MPQRQHNYVRQLRSPVSWENILSKILSYCCYFFKFRIYPSNLLTNFSICFTQPPSSGTRKGKNRNVDDEDDDFKPVSIDVNTVKNMLESLNAQAGLPGPASNILNSMGISVAPVEEETENENSASCTGRRSSAPPIPAPRGQRAGHQQKPPPGSTPNKPTNLPVPPPRRRSQNSQPAKPDVQRQVSRESNVWEDDFIMSNISKYCNCGYFRWRKISRKCWQDISRGGNFHNTTPISFIKVWFFSAPEPKAQVHYCDHALSVVRRPSVRPSVRPSLTFHIFDFSSETAERNSTKLDRKQDLNVLYQVCVFRTNRKNKMAALASDWLRHFRLLRWNRWMKFNET